MQTKTVQQLLSIIERMLYQAAGVDVQVYAQDIIVDKINQAFIRCFEAKFWPQFLVREVRTVDGVTGQVTVPFTSITTWEDVYRVFRTGSQKPLAIMPDSYNLLSLPTGTVSRFIAPSITSIFTVYPLEASDEILVIGRARPINTGDFSLSDIVPFDYMALAYHVAWEYAVDDASNGAMASKFQTLFDSRMAQLEDISFADFVDIAPNTSDIPTEWR